MQRLLAICWLTIKAALRFRLVTALIVMLLGGVILLPLIIKDDGTARGFTQILMTYTLSLITGLLGFATLWLACGVLARDIEESQIQLVAVKPVARWQIWLGKYMGLLALNFFLLVLAGVAVYSTLLYRSRNLSEKEQATLRNEVLVARGSLREPPPDIAADVEKAMKEKLKGAPADLNKAELRRIITEQIKAAYQVVPPGYRREWKIPLGVERFRLKDEPLFLRVKFNAAEKAESGNYNAIWEIGADNSPNRVRREMRLSDDTFHEFEIPANLFDESGMLTVNFLNGNDTAVLFTVEEGMEVLYREASFGLNFARGLMVIFCWLAFLGAMGLAASSLLSFPVAAFVTIGLLILGFSGSTLSQIIEQGGVVGINHETGMVDQPGFIDTFSVPMASAVLKLINVAAKYSPIDLLSSGRSVTWGMVGNAFSQIVLLLGGICMGIGMVILSRRELALPQGHQ